MMRQPASIFQGFPRSYDLPPAREQRLESRLLPELAFNCSDKPLTMAIDVVLGVKQRAPSSTTVGLKRFDVFLSLKLFLECWRGRGGASRLPDLSIEFLDLALQCLRRWAGVMTRIGRLRSAHFWEMTNPASMVFPKPTSSAKMAPLDSGDLNANRAAST
jgi:hypothetical protein